MKDLLIEKKVKEFVEKHPLNVYGLRSEWLHGSYISVYFRAGNWRIHHSNPEPVPLVIVANVSVTAEFENRGIYTAFLQFLTDSYPNVKIENVLVSNYNYEKQGFSLLESPDIDVCYIKTTKIA